MVLKADDPGYLRVLVDEGREATKRHLELEPSLNAIVIRHAESR